MSRPDIRFDQELSRGIESYGKTLGHWWLQQAADPVHIYAYRKIAHYIHATSVRAPRLIVDYACGCGSLLSRLSRRFPKSQLIGLDGSPLLLDLARKRIARRGQHFSDRVTLIQCPLPNFQLPEGLADLVVFAFPNIVPSTENGETLAEQHLTSDDLKVARDLAHAYHAQYFDSSDEPDILYADLLRDRLVSLHIRRLLKRGGICVRVEYGNIRREELPEVELLRTGMEEGSLDNPVNGIRTDQWFRVVASSYFRSGVMEDVYHQSGDIRDRVGGYFITVLKAL